MTWEVVIPLVVYALAWVVWLVWTLRFAHIAPDTRRSMLAALTLGGMLMGVVVYLQRRAATVAVKRALAQARAREERERAAQLEQQAQDATRRADEAHREHVEVTEAIADVLDSGAGQDDVAALLRGEDPAERS